MARFDRRRWLRLTGWGLGVALLGAAPRWAAADAVERHALVVAIDGADVLVDAGKPAGLWRGSPVRVFHLVIANHPTTGKPVKAAFPIGGAVVLEAGTALSLLSIADPALRARLVVGDEVRFEPRAAETEPERVAGAIEPMVSPTPTPTQTPTTEGSAEVLEGEARQALVNGKYVEALAKAAAAVEKEPGRPQALQIAGVSACYVGRVDLAARYAARLVAARQSVVRQVCGRRGTPLPEVLLAGEVPAAGSVGPAPGSGTGPVARPDPKLLEELAATFGAAAGQSQEQGFRIWQEYLNRHPDSPFAPRVRQELAQRSAESGGAAMALDTPGRGYHHQPATRIEAGHTLAVAVAIGVDEKPREVWLHHRRAGASTWQKRTLERDGDGYLRTTVPAAEVQSPGLEYFVEARTGDDAVSSVVADEESPIEVEVTEAVTVKAPRRRGLSRVSSLVEHVDFNTGGGADKYTMVEVDFAYRFMGPVYAMRVGLGTLQGEGGALDDYGGTDHTDDCPNPERCRERTFTYAYSELEFRAQKNLSVSGRVYAGGLQKPSTGGAAEVRRSAFGFMGSVRIGEERGTNLSLGIANVNDFGTTGELKLQWGKVARLPITGIVQATNLPSGKELGFRGAIEVGYQVTSWFYPTIRVGYNARTINHAGLAAGLALVFDW